jgi:hypothetical protein
MRRLILLVLVGIFLCGVGSGFSESLNVNIQVANDAGEILPGQYEFVFNISTDSLCGSGDFRRN